MFANELPAQDANSARIVEAPSISATRKILLRAIHIAYPAAQRLRYLPRNAFMT
jgi:hypothetical protein